MKKLFTLAAASLLGAALTTATVQAQQAAISWTAPVSIGTNTATLDLITNSYGTSATFFTAVDFSDLNNPQTVVTVGGQSISFSTIQLSGYAANGLTNSLNNITVTATNAAGGQHTGALFTNSLSGSGAAAFTSVMAADAWGLTTVDITGLTIGQTYAFTLFGSDNRTPGNIATNVFSDSFANSVHATENPGTATVGSFTATSSSEIINVTAQTNGVAALFSSSVSAITVYAVPEPATYVLFGLGALLLVVAYRRKVA